MTSTSIRDQLSPHRRDLWDCTWARLLVPAPDESSGDNEDNTNDNDEEQTGQSAA